MKMKKSLPFIIFIAGAIALVSCLQDYKEGVEAEVKEKTEAVEKLNKINLKSPPIPIPICRRYAVVDSTIEVLIGEREKLLKGEMLYRGDFSIEERVREINEDLLPPLYEQKSELDREAEAMNAGK